MLPVRIIRRKSSVEHYQNSFLKEIDFNPDISKEIRDVVEFRFKRSKTNSTYVFPRKQVSRVEEFLMAKREKMQSKQMSMKNLSYEKLPDSTAKASFLHKNDSLNRNKIMKKTVSLSFLDKFNVGYNRRLRMINKPTI
jgi:hypothetical protein